MKRSEKPEKSQSRGKWRITCPGLSVRRWTSSLNTFPTTPRSANCQPTLHMVPRYPNDDQLRASNYHLQCLTSTEPHATPHMPEPAFASESLSTRGSFPHVNESGVYLG